MLLDFGALLRRVSQQALSSPRVLESLRVIEACLMCLLVLILAEIPQLEFNVDIPFHEMEIIIEQREQLQM